MKNKISYSIYAFTSKSFPGDFLKARISEARTTTGSLAATLKIVRFSSKLGTKTGKRKPQIWSTCPHANEFTWSLRPPPQPAPSSQNVKCVLNFGSSDEVVSLGSSAERCRRIGPRIVAKMLNSYKYGLRYIERTARACPYQVKTNRTFVAQNCTRTSRAAKRSTVSLRGLNWSSAIFRDF